MEWIREYLGVPGAIALIGALITACGAVLASIDQNRKERQLRQRSDEIASLNREIAAKTDQIASLNRRIAEVVTGATDLSISFVVEEREVQGSRKTVALLVSGRERDHVARVRRRH